jgi:hypothetical protein
MNVARIEKVSSAGDVRTLSDAQHGEAHQDGAPLLSVTPSVSAASWPASQAFHGAAGDLVRAIEPHTEADPAALLARTLAAFGNVIGRSAHFRVEADRHSGNIFAVLVGVTAKGRKGTSLGQIKSVFENIIS